MAIVYLDINTKETGVRDCNYTEAGEVDAYSIRIPSNIADLNNDETKALVGCAPTAWGQLMKYHKWPPRGVGKLDYDFTYIGTSDKYYNIKVDRDLNHGFDFNWSNDKMPLVTPENPEGTEDNLKQYGDPQNYITTLLSDIGYALKCEWNIDGTACVSKANTISKYFGYSTSMEEFKHAIYNDIFNGNTGGWYKAGSNIDYNNVISAIEKDINSSMPLIFEYIYDEDGTLTLTSDDVGHSTVVDGYEYFDKVSFSISINLGWQNFGKNFYTFTRIPLASLVIDNSNKIYDFNITEIDIISNIAPCFGDENSNNCNSEYIQNGGKIKKPNFEIESGWNLKALSTNRDVTSNYFDNAEMIYTYRDEGNKTWYKNPTYISPKEGFWIKTTQSSSYALIGENDDNTTFVKLEDIEISDNRWYLLGTGKEIKSKELNETFYSKDLNFTIYVYDNAKNKWSDYPDTIFAGQGFWAKRNTNFINPLE